MIQQFFSFIDQLTTIEAFSYALIENLVIFGFALVLGHFLVNKYGDFAIGEPAPPVTRYEIILALSVVTLNAVITGAGWYLWKGGWIVVIHNASIWKIILDSLVLIIAMDLCMYIFHRIAHHPVVFPIVHVTHHQYENPRPLTLFVLNPIEALGFGVLWLVVLTLYQAHWMAIVFYLTFNVLFGLVGHTGVEIMPKGYLDIPVIRYISTSTFHAEHHMELGHNFGFYTLIWDKLFGTLNPNYLDDYTSNTTPIASPLPNPN